MWTARQIENNNVDGQNFIQFGDKNAVFEVIQLSVNVASFPILADNNETDFQGASSSWEITVRILTYDAMLLRFRK